MKDGQLHRLAFISVAIASLISTSIFVNVIVGNFILGIAVLSYALVSDYRFASPRSFISALFAVFAWYGILLIGGGAAPESLFRISSYLIVAFVCLFLIPSEIEFSYFIWVYTWLITAVVIIGLLTKAGLSVTIFGGEITTVPYHYRPYYFVGDPVSGEAIRSVFSSQNTFAPIVFFGAIFALFLYHHYGHKRYVILLGLNFTGLYFSHSRSAMLAFLVTIAIHTLYIAGWPRLVAICSIGTIPIVLTISAIGSGILPDPIYITKLVANRTDLWEGSVEALFDSYFLGAGPINSASAIEHFVPEINRGSTPHNAFLAMFATGGLIGGIGYAYLFFYTHIVQIQKLGDGIPIVLVALTIGITFLQLFEAYLLFGFTTQSVLIALTIGYAIQFSLGRWDDREHIQQMPLYFDAVESQPSVHESSD